MDVEQWGMLLIIFHYKPLAQVIFLRTSLTYFSTLSKCALFLFMLGLDTYIAGSNSRDHLTLTNIHTEQVAE